MSNEYLDLRDLSRELEELRSDRDALENEPDPSEPWTEDESSRLKELEGLENQLGSSLDDYSRDEPTAIADSYFAEAMQELAEDIGMIDKDSTMENYIDWERWASDCQADYVSFDFDGSTWWIRSKYLKMRCELCWNTIHNWEPSHHGIHLLCILRAQEENPHDRDEGPHSTEDRDYREGYDR